MERIARWEISTDYDFGQEWGTLHLEYEPADADSFEARLVERISEVWVEVAKRRDYPTDVLNNITFREALPTVTYGWREQLAEILHGARRTNHAMRVQQDDPRWTEDGLFFTNRGELRVYRRLKWRQENYFNPGETIGVYPIPRGRILGQTREPDFIVTYRGAVGIIEVDGLTHVERRANDMSRDELFKDAGVLVAYRIPVEALDSIEEVDGHLDRFFRRLTPR